ncbi:MAG: NlpC/P60 family protein [Terrisporobacter sp.]|uniref:NlpC/P60 family protein n=1 Tax=Terrisporobacter sp. TaxID=1965305 RepID=UPI002FCAF720
MIRTAESYSGTEYVVGASGTPRYEFESRNLWNLPKLKTVKTPQRGDLVFYKNSAGRIIHVAIYYGPKR